MSACIVILGFIKGTTAACGCQTLFHPRSVPYALCIRVKQALEKLEAEAIVKPVELSERAAQIILVVKRDGTIQVSGDYKLIVSWDARVDTYLLPQ